jgi:hypothetical protein
MNEKTCKVCRKETTLDAFYKNNLAKDGHVSKCKDCCKNYYKKYYKKNKRTIKRKAELWRVANRDKMISDHYKRRYGITTEEYLALCDKQDGCCAICNSNGVKLVVDHDHTSGKVRQLLCADCNLALGGFRDSSTILRAAANYIDHHKEFM